MNKIFIVLLLVSLCACSFRVGHDENDYSQDQQKCIEEKCVKRAQNTTDDTVLQKDEECIKQCQGNRKNATIILAVILSVIGVLVLVCLIIVLIKPIKKCLTEKKEFSRRKPVQNKISEQQFDRYLNEFENVFTQNERRGWQFYYEKNNTKEEMQWFSMSLKRKSAFEAQMVMNGQDPRGTWVGQGFYVYTQSGPLVWWFKKYAQEQNLQNDGAMLIFELQRESADKFEGRWYYSGSQFVQNRSGKTVLKKIGSQPYSSSENLNGQIISLPDSQLHF